MAGESITQVIFFIAAIIIAVAVIGAVTTNVSSITVSYSLNSKTQADQLRTDITIINDPMTIPSSTTPGFGGPVWNYSFYVKNTGWSTLDPLNVNMFIDGNYTNVSSSWTVDNGGVTWYPAYVLRLNYTTKNSLSSGDHTISVVTGNGVSDTMVFKIQ